MPVPWLSIPGALPGEGVPPRLCSLGRCWRCAEAAPEGFCIQYTNRRVRRLHLVGSCKEMPGEHYREFDCWGIMLPPVHEFECICHAFFKGTVLAPSAFAPNLPEEDLAASSSSTSSPSDAGSDVEVGSPVKRRKQ